MGSIAFIAFGDIHQAGILQHLEVAAEVAVGKTAQLLEIAEDQPLGCAISEANTPSLAFS